MAPDPSAFFPAPGVLECYASRYQTADGHEFVTTLYGDHLKANYNGRPEIVSLLCRIGSSASAGQRPGRRSIWTERDTPSDSSSRSVATGETR